MPAECLDLRRLDRRRAAMGPDATYEPDRKSASAPARHGSLPGSSWFRDHLGSCGSISNGSVPKPSATHDLYGGRLLLDGPRIPRDSILGPLDHGQPDHGNRSGYGALSRRAPPAM